MQHPLIQCRDQQYLISIMSHLIAYKRWIIWMSFIFYCKWILVPNISSLPTWFLIISTLGLPLQSTNKNKCICHYGKACGLSSLYIEQSTVCLWFNRRNMSVCRFGKRRTRGRRGKWSSDNQIVWGGKLSGDAEDDEILMCVSVCSVCVLSANVHL